MILCNKPIWGQLFKTIPMKKFYIILFALFMASGARAQWVPLNSGTGVSLLSVYFTDVNTGYVVGENGTILKTIDGGSNWNAQNSGTANMLNSVYFPDDSIGYAVGDSGTILKTTDGGSNWTSQNISEIMWLYSVFFTSSDTGYIAGSFFDSSDWLGIIFKTTDGGINWDTNFTIDGYLFSIHFPSPDTGYVLGHTYLVPLLLPITLKTVDGGENWTQFTTGCGYIPAAVYFINVDTGFIVGSYDYPQGLFYKTLDGGVNWTLQTGDYDRVNSVYFPDSDIGYAVGGGDNGLILKTNDGGTRWYKQDSLISYGLLSVYFPNNDTGYVVGYGGIILKTTNGGLLVGINEKTLTIESLKIYPDPSSTTITIEMPTTPIKNTILTIYNINGQQLTERQITEQQTVVDVSGLSKGIYFVRVRDDRTVMVGNFVKQ
jgi:photosystem II stability/assembly factor-like uncharacterized protein